ncbi:MULTISPECIES: hypothetical protein [Thermoactinomyces]|uniref:Uncharacterized protein n=1 Tax=Thermoactinomyces vulgaris TaxID=2026 RepID=A0ABS0QEU3_THEVU|nr:MULTISPECIES: hypothetical protein [Thermoactinomyces]MBA4550530.1 hypothetical protein [Thermoactinomyces vulgaris]MBA4595941.1 hypothetical protein [Thermoactinomyces vulgaris]MBH8582414.1 hypothetical protein [Thermoactinomyces sp. CICC 10735]MBH8584790.1 hypothetical protein [Thermoactinomyces sp. CICC 10520]MBH8587274.1 hypothetical protein [Thermoactinomyces vulgaris]
MFQNSWLWIFVGLCILFSLIITIRLGVNQSPEQNQGYVKRRRKIVWLLLSIYVAAVVVWVAFVFPFLF